MEPQNAKLHCLIVVCTLDSWIQAVDALSDTDVGETAARQTGDIVSTIVKTIVVVLIHVPWLHWGQSFSSELSLDGSMDLDCRTMREGKSRVHCEFYSELSLDGSMDSDCRTMTEGKSRGSL